MKTTHGNLFIQLFLVFFYTCTSKKLGTLSLGSYKSYALPETLQKTDNGPRHILAFR